MMYTTEVIQRKQTACSTQTYHIDLSLGDKYTYMSSQVNSSIAVIYVHMYITAMLSLTCDDTILL